MVENEDPVKMFVLVNSQVLFHQTTLGQPSDTLMIADVLLVTMIQRDHHGWVTKAEDLVWWSVRIF